jgi:hypothetical protein
MSGVTSILTSLLGGAKKGGGAQKDTEVMSQPPDTLKASQSTHIYHRGVYRLLLKIALVQNVTSIVLVSIALWIIIAATPMDRFFVSSVDGRIDRVIPLDTPLMDNSELFSRAATNVADAMTFGFLDYEQRRIQVGLQFEPAALQQLQKTLIGEGGLSQMGQEGRAYVSVVNPALGGGVLRQGINQDFIYEWVVAAPIDVVTHTGLQATQKVRTPWMVNVLVQRARRMEVNRGYIITQIISAQPLGPGIPEAEQPATPGGTP